VSEKSQLAAINSLPLRRETPPCLNNSAQWVKKRASIYLLFLLIFPSTAQRACTWHNSRLYGSSCNRALPYLSFIPDEKWFWSGRAQQRSAADKLSLIMESTYPQREFTPCCYMEHAALCQLSRTYLYKYAISLGYARSMKHSRRSLLESQFLL